MATPKTVKTYDLDGTVKEWDISFEYLARRFVIVTLIGSDRKELVLNTDFRFVSSTRIATMRSAAWGPADGYETIEIRRVTSATDRLVDFADGSILRAYDLNTSQVQSLHIAEEARDLTADTIAVNEDGDLDARGKRIVNLADATGPDHAVTLRQEQEWAASTLSNRNAAEAAASSATASKNASSTSASQALTSKNAAEAAQEAAETAAEFAEDTITAINDQVAVATAKASSASASATTATTKAAEASTARDTAVTKAAEALVSAQNAADAGLQMGMSTWGFRSNPFKGFALDDGQELDRSVYPSFVAMLDAGLLPVVSEATWQADPTKRGCFVATSSTGKFRMRDLNGVQAGSIGGLFQRGSSVATPAVRMDQLQNITGEALATPAVGLLGPDGVTSGAFKAGLAVVGNRVTGTAAANSTGLGFDASLVARTGTETAPKQVTGAWMTRLYGLITPLGSAEASSLATSYASLAARLGSTEARLSSLVGVAICRQTAWEDFGLVWASTWDIVNPFGNVPVHSANQILRCKSADQGYVPGDIVYPGDWAYSNAAARYAGTTISQVSPTPGNWTGIRLTLGKSAFVLPAKSTGVAATCTAARWDVSYMLSSVI